MSMIAESTDTPTLEIKGVKLTEEMIAKFWDKVNKNGPISEYCPELGPCWLWTGGKFTSGYGQTHVWDGLTRKTIRAHRLSFVISRGFEPGDGLHTRHLCHSKLCQNPAHLEWGTCQDNADDKVAAGRQLRGERLAAIKRATGARGVTSWNHKIVDEDVREMRRLASAGLKTAAISKALNISKRIVWPVITGRTWRHVA